MPFAPANENFEGVVRKLLLGMPYLQWLGLSFVHIAPGEVDFAMPLRRGSFFPVGPQRARPFLVRCSFSKRTSTARLAGLHSQHALWLLLQ